MKKLSFILIIVTLSSGYYAQAQQQFRPPAYPLITVDPYFSIWSFHDTINAAPTVHWTGRENSLQGIIRVDGHAYYFLGVPMASYNYILPFGGNTGVWKYTFSKPENNWNSLHYNDISWNQNIGAFITGNGAPNKWMKPNFWVRRIFKLNTTDFSHLMLNLFYNDNVTVYLNGVLAYKAYEFNEAPELFEISDAAKSALKKGENVLAIHCEHTTTGGAYLDAGLVDEVKPDQHIAKASQTSVKISATQTFYHFTCSDVALQLTFTDPLLPDHLNIFSRPADYITFKVHSLDGKQHHVQLYFSAAGNIAVNTPGQKVTWQRNKAGNLDMVRVGTVAQNILGRRGDDVRIDWGYLYLAAPTEDKTSTLIASSEKSVEHFVQSGNLDLSDDKNIPRAAGYNPITLAASYDLGAVSSAPVSRHLILAYDQINCIEYFHQKLKPWWARNGMSVTQMLVNAAKDYSVVLQKCDQFDSKLYHQTLNAGGKEYAKMCELAYRQAFAACKLAAGTKGNPLLFPKECFSDGDISTVDVIFPTCPITLVYNPVLLKALLDPIFYFCESGRFTKPYSPHDLGTYPVANGADGETMPIEETGNMLIMVAAISRAEGNASYAKEHWKVLSQWADYLLKYGMDPKNQLCTDDFAGPSAHNANLSIKAILGIASYGKMAAMLGEKTIATEYADTAKQMALKWIRMDEDGNHFKLAFDQPGTWSQKYNLVWDKVLQLHLFPKFVAQKATQYYLTKQNEYGLPLDSRKTYTKADWIMWTATLAENEKDFQALIEPEYKYICKTPSRVPISDWYETTNAEEVGFQARSVVGGFFMKTLDNKWNR